jgi:hypothetical protein
LTEYALKSDGRRVRFSNPNLRFVLISTGSHKPDPLLNTFEWKKDQLTYCSQSIHCRFLRSRSAVLSKVGPTCEKVSNRNSLLLILSQLTIRYLSLSWLNKIIQHCLHSSSVNSPSVLQLRFQLLPCFATSRRRLLSLSSVHLGGLSPQPRGLVVQSFSRPK